MWSVPRKGRRANRIAMALMVLHDDRIFHVIKYLDAASQLRKERVCKKMQQVVTDNYKVAYEAPLPYVGYIQVTIRAQVPTRSGWMEERETE